MVCENLLYGKIFIYNMAVPMSAEKKKKIIIDFSKCVGCHTCELVCSLTHEGIVNPSLARIRVINSNWTMMPMNCRHCEDAPCIDACPTDALYHDEDGAVMLAEDKCIGCFMCAIACPYGIPRFNEITGVMFKCDLCADRRAEGKEPACVEACPSGALIFEDVNELMRLLREKSPPEASTGIECPSGASTLGG